MNSSTTPFGPDFAKQIVEKMFDSFEKGTLAAYRIIWDSFMQLLAEHWIAVTMILSVVLIYAIVRALMGHWWVLGSVLYNYFYFGILFVVGLTFGPEIFANDYFKIILVLVYILCYTLVGKILSKTGLHRTRF